MLDELRALAAAAPRWKSMAFVRPPVVTSDRTMQGSRIEQETHANTILGVEAVLRDGVEMVSRPGNIIKRNLVELVEHQTNRHQRKCFTSCFSTAW